MGSHATSTQVHASIESALDGKARIARLFEMTSDLLATISLDGRFTLLNPAWEQLLGWTREELRERPIREFVHPDDVEQTLGAMLDRDGGPTELENITTRYQHRDGSWRWLLWSARRDGDSWYAAAKDVTDRVWLERQALHDPLTQPAEPAAADGSRPPGARATAPQRQAWSRCCSSTSTSSRRSTTTSATTSATGCCCRCPSGWPS